MWVMMTDGFVSIVEDRNHKDRVLVRARKKSHLVEFLRHERFEICHTPTADYHWRASLTKVAVGVLLMERAMSIDYDNFKAAAKKVDPDLADAYGDVWATMYDYQTEQADLHKYGYGKGKASPQAKR